MDIIIEYFVSAVKAILALVGVELDERFEENIKNMINGLKDYQPETEDDSIKL